MIRTIESKFLEYYSKGLIKGTVHTCLGKEAFAVGLLNAIDQDLDIVFDDFFDVITIKNAAGYAPLELRRISTHNAGF